MNFKTQLKIPVYNYRYGVRRRTAYYKYIILNKKLTKKSIIQLYEQVYYQIWAKLAQTLWSESKSEIQITQPTVFCQKKLLFKKYRTKNELENHKWA